MILLALETAMRLGELLSLKWSRVDLDRGFAELQKTKNGHDRMVPLTAALHCLCLVTLREMVMSCFRLNPAHSSNHGCVLLNVLALMT